MLRASRISFPAFGSGLAGFRRVGRKLRKARATLRWDVERLEDRMLLSAILMTPDHTVYHSANSLIQSSSAGYLSPAQIRHAYGFDQITFGGGIQGNGAGQTIAIVDAYDDPNIAHDLAIFDQTFQLPAPPSFTKVNQTGGTQYPAGNSDWAMEIALDVEWAHAIASGSKILLVEAASSSFNDLLAAVDYARSQPGVSAVSMSWGGAEFSGETSYDAHFTTPGGHAGVTFVASSGDNGAPPSYPAASPNVLAVGGTTLNLKPDNTWDSETSWSSSGGGICSYEPKPSYQSGVMPSVTKRTNPDVAYDADPATGFYVYDTYQYSGWYAVGGTSAGAPQWAALIAIADQGRALIGLGSLDGPSQTLPQIYQMPASIYHDITAGNNGYPAGLGYDLVTGRGSPIAILVIANLAPANNTAPTVVTPASATPNPVTGTTTALSVLGADGGGEANLKYIWAATTLPSGATAPTFSANGTNAAKKTVATFSKGGSYGFTVTIADAAGLTTTSSVKVTVNQTLTSIIISPASVNVTVGGTQQFTTTVKDQFGNALATQPSFTWVATAGTITPGGLFTAPKTTGSVTVTATSGSFKSSATVTTRYAAPTVVTPASATSSPVTGTTTALSVLGADGGGEANLKYIWAATTLPSGATAPTFSANGTNAAKKILATFSKGGSYGFTVTIADAAGLTTTSSVKVTVNQTLTSIIISPASVNVTVGGTQQFTTTVKDQFGNALATQPSFTWVATAGTITPGGLFTAPKTTGSVTVTATSGSFKSSVTVNVNSSFLNLQDQALENLVQGLDVRDGSISRQDMIQIFQSIGKEDGVVDVAEFSDLKTILNNAVTLKIPSYVQVLAGDVVNGSAANVHFQGQALGNLAAGSSAVQLNELVEKWFLGADHPAAGNYKYLSVAGSSFVAGPTYTDMYQGYLGDCYLIASLGSLAKSSPAVIQNMIIDNGDNTWTVRFYANGTPDYITVDRMLPTDSSGHLVYADCGVSSTNAGNELWIPLVEKAYAEWNETGKEGRDNTNSYPSIAGGWMADVYAQVLGRGAQNYGVTQGTKQAIIDSIGSNEAVTIGTIRNGDGLYGYHAYTVIGYTMATDTFQLYNPWGTHQPGPLTWAQLLADCNFFVVADTSGTVAATPPTRRFG